jgi:hypothetical protein
LCRIRGSRIKEETMKIEVKKVEKVQATTAVLPGHATF